MFYKYFVSAVSAIVLMISSALLYAEPRVSKDWFWGVDDTEFFYAATLNSSEHIIGQYCYLESGNCMYMVGIGITCEEGYETPALINSNKGAVQIKLVCAHKYEDQNVLFITPFDDIDNIIRQASHIRIAVPMENDQFKVSRFSLSGSSYAIDLMRAAAERAVKEKPPEKTKTDVEYL